MLLQGKKKFVSLSAEIVFRTALKIAQVRHDTALLQEVISHPITAVPTSMFHEDGTMRKTVKAELTHVLEKQVSESENNQIHRPQPGMRWLSCILSQITVKPSGILQECTWKTFLCAQLKQMLLWMCLISMTMTIQ